MRKDFSADSENKIHTHTNFSHGLFFKVIVGIIEYIWWHLKMHLIISILNRIFFTFFHVFKQWATFARMWYLLDGKMQPPGKLAAIASQRLQGLHKPVYHQLSEYCLGHVISNRSFHSRRGTLWSLTGLCLRAPFWAYMRILCSSSSDSACLVLNWI